MPLSSFLQPAHLLHHFRAIQRIRNLAAPVVSAAGGLLQDRRHLLIALNENLILFLERLNLLLKLALLLFKLLLVPLARLLQLLQLHQTTAAAHNACNILLQLFNLLRVLLLDLRHLSLEHFNLALHLHLQRILCLDRSVQLLFERVDQLRQIIDRLGKRLDAVLLLRNSRFQRGNLLRSGLGRLVSCNFLARQLVLQIRDQLFQLILCLLHLLEHAGSRLELRANVVQLFGEHVALFLRRRKLCSQRRLDLFQLGHTFCQLFNLLLQLCLDCLGRADKLGVLHLQLGQLLVQLGLFRRTKLLQRLLVLLQRLNQNCQLFHRLSQHCNRGRLFLNRRFQLGNLCRGHQLTLGLARL